MNTLDGKVALITGAKGGLGNYVTCAMLGAGAKVAGVSRTIKDSDFPNANFYAVPAELSSLDAARATAATVLERLGHIDILVHLMGGFAGGAPVHATDDATIERMFDLNLRSAFHIFRAVLPVMRKQSSGRILAIGSRPAVDPQGSLGAYAASKAALVNLVRTVAIENADAGISANIVLPGAMDTPANRAAMPGTDASKWIPPDQVAGLLVHLASDGGANVSGAVIPVYGREV